MATKLFLDTRSGQRPLNYNTYFHIQNPRLQNLSNIKATLRSIQFPNAVYPINSFNNNFSITEDGITDVPLVIPQGVYTGTTYAVELQKQLNDAGGLADVYTVTYNTISKIMSVSSTGTFSFVVVDDNIYESMGFDETLFTGLSASFTGSYPINISGTQYVDVCTNLASYSYSTKTNNHVLARIPIEVAFGGIVFYKNEFHENTEITNHHISDIYITLHDDKGNFYELPDNAHVSMELILDGQNKNSF